MSVSVLDKTCERADALATAFMVMGPYQGKIMANKEKLAVYFLIKEEKGYIEWQSEQFEKKLQSILKRN